MSFMPMEKSRYGIPGYGDYGVESEGIKRRRKMVEMLRQQSMSPIEGQPAIGGIAVPISPWQGLAKIAKALSASYSENKLDEQEKDLATRQRTDRSDTMKRFADALKGTEAKPAIDMPPEEVGGGPGRAAIPAQPGSPQAGYQVLMESQDPTLQQVGMQGYVKAMEPQKPVVVGRTLVDPKTGKVISVDSTWQQEQESARLDRSEQARLAREARMQELQMRLQDQRLAAQDRAALQRELAQMQIQAREDLLRVGASLRPPPQGPQPQVIQTEQGTFVIDRPGAEARPVLTPDGKQLPGKADRPMTEFQGKAALYGTRAQQSHNILNDLEEKISTSGLAVKRGLESVPLVGGVLGAAGNVALSKDQQRVEQAQRDFVNAVLRQESGAVISDAEFANAQKQYFPAPGDSPDVLKQKRRNREIAISGFERMAGREGAAAIGDIRNNAPLRGTPDRRGGNPPAGVDPALWGAMTEQERALWRR
jgi:hypothetical protein